MGHSEGMIIFTQMHSSEERLEKKGYIYIYIRHPRVATSPNRTGPK